MSSLAGKLIPELKHDQHTATHLAAPLCDGNQCMLFLPFVHSCFCVLFFIRMNMERMRVPFRSTRSHLKHFYRSCQVKPP